VARSHSDALYPAIVGQRRDDGGLAATVAAEKCNEWHDKINFGF
jgi:hypothetical protein